MEPESFFFDPLQQFLTMFGPPILDVFTEPWLRYPEVFEPPYPSVFNNPSWKSQRHLGQQAQVFSMAIGHVRQRCLSHRPQVFSSDPSWQFPATFGHHSWVFFPALHAIYQQRLSHGTQVFLQFPTTFGPPIPNVCINPSLQVRACMGTDPVCFYQPLAVFPRGVRTTELKSCYQPFTAILSNILANNPGCFHQPLAAFLRGV